MRRDFNLPPGVTPADIDGEVDIDEQIEREYDKADQDRDLELGNDNE